MAHELGGPMLLLTVGPAASGKSTLLSQLIAADTVDEVVSTDALRAELGMPPAETATTYAAARQRVRDALDKGHVVAVDSTNVRRRDRADWLAVATSSGARAVAVRVGVGLDLEQLLVRDGGRDRHVPRDVIAGQLAMARAITPEVLTGEGFTVAEVEWDPDRAQACLVVRDEDHHPVHERDAAAALG